jgi:hypothetical protein
MVLLLGVGQHLHSFVKLNVVSDHHVRNVRVTKEGRCFTARPVQIHDFWLTVRSCQHLKQVRVVQGTHISISCK